MSGVKRHYKSAPMSLTVLNIQTERLLCNRKTPFLSIQERQTAQFIVVRPRCMQAYRPFHQEVATGHSGGIISSAGHSSPRILSYTQAAILSRPASSQVSCGQWGSPASWTTTETTYHISFTLLWLIHLYIIQYFYVPIL
jgi:hypothetical protein